MIESVEVRRRDQGRVSIVPNLEKKKDLRVQLCDNWNGKLHFLIAA